jgi:hypothetical protein
MQYDLNQLEIEFMYATDFLPSLHTYIWPTSNILKWYNTQWQHGCYNHSLRNSCVSCTISSIYGMMIQ